LGPIANAALMAPACWRLVVTAVPSGFVDENL
jgi:hypothetical protein